MRFEPRRRAKDAVIDWRVWYSRRKLHSALGYLSPKQYVQRWLAGQPKSANLWTRLVDSHSKDKLWLSHQ